MKLIGEIFARDYLNLVLTGLDTKRFWIVIFIEAIAAILTLVAVCFFGLLIQVLLDESALNNSAFGPVLSKFLPMAWLNNLNHFELILLVSIISLIVGLVALFLEFTSLKFIRKTTREAYAKSLNNHIIAFRESPSSLSLSTKSLQSFRSSFTIDAHITFNAFEVILKCFRPITYIFVFSIAVIIIQASALLVIFVFVVICVPFITNLNKQTLNSAKGVLGQQRKSVYAEIINLVDRIDLNKHQAKNNKKTYLPNDFDLMLDSFDFWKLSSDKSNYTLQILKVIGLHLAIISIGLAAYIDNSFNLTSFVLLALIVFKLSLSIINLLTRLTALSRLFPIVNRYLCVVEEVSNAHQINNSHSDKTERINTSKDIWIGLSTSSPLRKSEIGVLSKDLIKTYPDFNLTSLSTQKYGTIGELTHKKFDFNEILNRFILESNNDMSESFLEYVRKINVDQPENMKEIVKPIDSEKAWKRASPEIRVMLNLLILIYDDTIEHIICKPASVNFLKSVLDANKFTHRKPIITFDSRLTSQIKQPYDVVLVPPKTLQDESDQLL